MAGKKSLTKVFFGIAFILVNSDDTGLKHSQKGNMLGQNTKTTTERWYINLLHIGCIVEYLHRRSVGIYKVSKQANRNTDLIWGREG